MSIIHLIKHLNYYFVSILFRYNYKNIHYNYSDETIWALKIILKVIETRKI
jgi:hypothetical protein